jgi:hypothetical protein
MDAREQELAAALEAARTELAAAHDAHQAAAAALDEARREVTAAEAAYESDESDPNWRRVADARDLAARRELSAKKAATRHQAARLAASEAEQAYHWHRLQRARETLSAESFLRAALPELRELAALDGKMLAAVERIRAKSDALKSAHAEGCEAADALNTVRRYHYTELEPKPDPDRYASAHCSAGEWSADAILTLARTALERGRELRRDADALAPFRPEPSANMAELLRKAGVYDDIAPRKAPPPPPPEPSPEQVERERAYVEAMQRRYAAQGLGPALPPSGPLPNAGGERGSA